MQTLRFEAFLHMISSVEEDPVRVSDLIIKFPLYLGCGKSVCFITVLGHEDIQMF